jgi:epoxyqueuosine reductase
MSTATGANGIHVPGASARLADAIKAAARTCGAHAVRIATAETDEPARARMDAAFLRGDLATWPYDAAYARAATDPATLLPGARSVICIAIPYATPPPRERRGRGRVSAYAWSTDYHHRMRALLREIAERIDALAGAAVTRIACDTAPLAERAFAARAGLGWIGKHTSLIVKGLGSAVFLGEIVTTLELEPDAPLQTSCGTCTRCIDVCPTRALRGDRTIDATRCISDLTQRRDAIPRALRPLIGTWVWGCDLCNDACPPSIRAGTAGDPAFEPLDDTTAAPDLHALLRMRGAAFKRFRRSAMGWRGATVLRRNAAVALGNGLDRADVPALAGALHSDPSALVRGHAAWALGRIGSPQAYAALRIARTSEADGTVLEEIDSALEPARPEPAFNGQSL